MNIFTNQQMAIIFLVLFILVIFIKTRKREKYSHKWRKKSSIKVLNKIQDMEASHIFVYLRKIDPFVMEELIMDSLDKREDIKVIRNNRYTGDNGVDGKFILTEEIEGKKIKYKYIVQVKRYKSYINPKHVEEFIQHINREKAHKGLFIHTGKTSNHSFNLAHNEDKLSIISGSKLISLLKEQKI